LRSNVVGHRASASCGQRSRSVYQSDSCDHLKAKQLPQQLTADRVRYGFRLRSRSWNERVIHDRSNCSQNGVQYKRGSAVRTTTDTAAKPSQKCNNVFTETVSRCRIVHLMLSPHLWSVVVVSQHGMLVDVLAMLMPTRHCSSVITVCLFLSPFVRGESRVEFCTVSKTFTHEHLSQILTTPSPYFITAHPQSPCLWHATLRRNSENLLTLGSIWQNEPRLRLP